MSYYLAIVSPLDTPLFELQFTSARPTSTQSQQHFPSWSSFTGHNGSDLSQSQQQGQQGQQSQQQQQQLQQQEQQQANLVLGGGEKYVLQMIAHAALDAVEEVADGTGSLYLKAVDRHNEWTVSAFLATNVKLILLHDTKNDDGIRLFFGEVWEIYTKAALNPFHTVNTPIRNPLFETKVRAAAKRFL